MFRVHIEFTKAAKCALGNRVGVGGLNQSRKGALLPLRGRAQLESTSEEDYLQ
jgi:hypothetical protein